MGSTPRPRSERRGRSYETRRDIYGEDALGWALLADGRASEAVRYADRSLRLGTQDPRLLAHAGLAHAAAGDTDRARDLLTAAVTLSPTVDPLLMSRVRAASRPCPRARPREAAAGVTVVGVLAAASALSVALAPAASAHPLGNFTRNTYVGFTVTHGPARTR